MPLLNSFHLRDAMNFARLLALSVYLIAVCSGAPADLSDDETQAKQWLKEYNKRASEIYYSRSVAAWNWSTNITDYNQNISVQVSLESSKFTQMAAENASKFNWQNFHDEDVKRQLNMVTDLETSALDKSKLERLNNVQAELKKIYSSGEVCNITGHGCLQMEPGLTALMANSRNYDELVAGWKGWRNATGKQMKDLYAEFVELRNEGSKISGR